jgi:hypothetical protein
MTFMFEIPVIGFAIYFFGSLIVNHEIEMINYFPYACISHLFLLITHYRTNINYLKEIILSLRSLLCSSYFIYDKPIHYIYCTCMGTMVLVDIVDCFYNSDIVYNEDLNEYIDFMPDVITYFMFENMYTAYVPIFTYQLSMMISNKNQQYNVYYHWLLNSNILVLLKTNYLFAPLSYCASWYIYQNHKVNKENKYICWTALFVGNILVKNGIDKIEKIETIPYDFYLYPLGYVILFYVYQYFSYVGIWSKIMFESELQLQYKL